MVLPFQQLSLTFSHIYYRWGCSASAASEQTEPACKVPGASPAKLHTSNAAILCLCSSLCLR